MITPSIVGIAFLKPKLKAVYEVIILFGPGEKAVAIPNKINGRICIYLVWSSKSIVT